MLSTLNLIVRDVEKHGHAPQSEPGTGWLTSPDSLSLLYHDRMPVLTTLDIMTYTLSHITVRSSS